MTERHKIVFAANTEYEKVLYIERPKGKKAREMMPKVLSFAGKVQSLGEDERNDMNTILAVVDAFFGRDEFENELVPYVLGLDDEKGRKFLEDNGTMIEVMDAFNDAAGWLISQSFGRAEVQEALGKSQEEVHETRKRKAQD